ncbi:MAG TPA: [FeFe] hydrogenase H-cluster radical SAM maturase HydE [Treponemataceae bacterium]|nr:[FeFe] hydrogenase H-cluster radical SAM maturase HydE [Treponemataceae bacterium]
MSETNPCDFAAALDRTASASDRGRAPRLDDLETLLDGPDGPAETDEALFAAARAIRDATSGERMFLRGLVEFSSYCGNTCFYCGLNRANRNAARYRLTADEIFSSAQAVRDAGIRTIVLQSGEDGMDARWLADVVSGIKARFPEVAITLSVGERSRADYSLWREAGADRYLMRVETSDPVLYASIHAGRELATRLRCLDDLRDLGYQVGSGIMVGFPGQTLAHIARDVAFFRERDFDMIGIGPFIPHPDTVFRNARAGSVGLTLRTVAVTRIVTRSAYLPATTALGSMDRDYRVDGLRAGANVVMPNFTPALHKKDYEIYPGKRCVTERTGACAGCMAGLARMADLELDYARADTLKGTETRGPVRTRPFDEKTKVRDESLD